jgi:putative endonuclease
MNRIIGQKGEEYAALFLRQKGYRIIHQNLYTRFGEIDIVASKGGRIVFVEVKTRKSLNCGHPEDAFTRNKYRLLLKSAWYYTSKSHYRGLWRVDLVAIIMNSFDEVEDIRHYRNVTF